MPLGQRQVSPSWTLFQMHSVRVLLVLLMLFGLSSTAVLFTAPLDASRPVSPAQSLRLDRQAHLLAVLTGRIISSVLIWLCFGPVMALAYGIYAGVAVSCETVLGAGYPESS